jgi:signal transduction histidine kinase
MAVISLYGTTMIKNIFQNENQFDDLLIIYRQAADKMMLWVILGLQLVCFALAPINETWGSVLFIGIPTLALAAFLVRHHCGKLLTRLYIAAALMTYTGLIIHQTNGDIEGHFSAFGLVGMLLYYRDWRTIISATIFIYLHHLVLGYVQTLGLPIYVFDSPDFWQLFFIHVAYFLPFIAMMTYISVSLRREGSESQMVIRYANNIAQGKSDVTDENTWLDATTKNTDIIRSVTDMSNALHQARVAVEKSNEMLRYEVGVKNRFFSIISHDLKSPFTTLLGMTSMMSQMADNFSKEKLVEYAVNVNEAGDTVFELLQNLLEWSRLQMEGDMIEPQIISLHDITQENINILSPMAKGKDITLKSTIKKDIAYADQDMVQSVIRNLIINSLKFTPSGGEIEVSSRKNGDLIHVTVKDTGVGIIKEKIDKIFALDQKTSTIGTAGENGTGLGLPLCKEMLEKNGGKIWVESTPGEGSKFHFSLPMESDKK